MGEVTAPAAGASFKPSVPSEINAIEAGALTGVDSVTVHGNTRRSRARRGVDYWESMMMTHRERVLRALNHEEPDRVPMDLGGCLASSMVGQAYPALRRELGLADSNTRETLHYAGLAVIDEDVRQALDVDIVHAPNTFGTSDAVKIISDDRFIDEWGVCWRRPEHGHFYVDEAPFARHATPAAVARYEWPSAENLVRVEGLANQLRRLRRESDYAISLELRGRVMSIGQFLRGFGEWLMDLVDNRSFAAALLDRTTQIQIEVNEKLLREVGDLVDIVYTSDDLGAQDGPLFSPACFADLFAPHFRRLWGHIRSRTSAKLMHHCCGSVVPFIGSFVEMGVEVLNPIQVSAARMEPAKLKAEFGADLSFWGGIDTRTVMPRGTVADVRDEVRRRVTEMASGGGYILAAVHNLQPEVPPANIVAMYRAGAEFGQYPPP